MNDARKFLDQVYSDPSLQTKLDAVGWKANEAVSIGAAAGLSFTAADLKAASAARQGELSERDLDKVAGGSIIMPDAKPRKPFIFC